VTVEAEFQYLKPEQPDDPLAQIVKQLGKPKFCWTAKDYQKLTQPIVYILARHGALLYIGMSSRGVCRPLDPGHQAIPRIEPGDCVYVWVFKSVLRVEQLESHLIRKFIPAYNGKPTGKDLAAQRAVLTKKINRLKRELKEAKACLNGLSPKVSENHSQSQGSLPLQPALRIVAPVKRLLWNPAEVAAMLNVDESWLTAKINAGEVQHVRLGPREIRFSQDCIDALWLSTTAEAEAGLL